MNKTFQQRIWLTYESAGALHAGGLERVSVWFEKPDYYYMKNTKDWEDQDLPFGYETGQREGCQQPVGWWGSLIGRGEKNSVSFGKVFGYGDGFASMVWDKLCKHFDSDNLRIWSDIEKEGKALPENFCLEVYLNIDPVLV